MNDYIAKKGSKALVAVTAQTTNGMAVKFLNQVRLVS